MNTVHFYFRSLLCAFCYCFVVPVMLWAQTGEDFWEHWGDGKAEVSSYEVKIPRYDVQRPGYDVLIFVTEDFDSQRQVKTDHRRASTVPVLKLNHARRFQTGVYDYAMMLSVFYPVNVLLKSELLAPLKSTLAVTEWCGNYFEQLNRQGSVVTRLYRSYFESEGDGQESIGYSRDTLFEDDLLIRIRELTQPFSAGTYPIITSSFYGRLQQFTPARKVTRVERSVMPAQDTVFGKHSVIRYRIQIGERSFTGDVLDAEGRQVLRWERKFKIDTTEYVERAGLLKTERIPYWQLQGAAGKNTRSKLLLPEIVTDDAVLENSDKVIGAYTEE